MAESKDESVSPTLAAMRQEANVLGAFRLAWQAESPPSIAGFLLDQGPGRVELLLQLAATDLAFRRQRGQPACVEMYVRRWPELAADTDVLVELIRREWDLRAEEAPERMRQELCERFPEVASVIAQMPQPRPRTPTEPAPLQNDTPRGVEGEERPLPRIPGYKILGELGRGGFGIVYRARQLAADRLVALKMIKPGSYIDVEHMARFRREAEAMARLQHPHVAQVYEVGEHAGQPFFTMEYCPGGTLAEKLAGKPLTPQEAAALMQTLAEAVETAHQKGVIHRDLKPGNVLLGESGTPKVSDFGLARRVEGAGTLTATGAVLGTPAYMAPEQADGGKEVGPPADVYALGAILYECLTGRPPFLAATNMDCLLQLKTQEPVAPRQLNAKVPRDLNTITLKCLEKEPARRYAHASDLAADLKRWQTNEPIAARPVGTMERAAKWVRRRPGVAALLATLVALVVVSFAAISTLYLQADSALREAEEQHDRAKWMGEMLEGRFEDPMGLEGGAYRIAHVGGESLKAQELLRRAANKATQQLQYRKNQQAAVFATIGSSYRALEEFDEAEKYIKLALAHWEAQGSRGDVDRAKALHQLGMVHHQRGRLERDDYAQAEKLYTQALATYPPSRQSLILESRVQLGWLVNEQEEFARAADIFDGVVAEYDKTKRPKDRLYYRAVLGTYSTRIEPETARQGITPGIVGEMLQPLRQMLELEPDPTWGKALDLFANAARILATVEMAKDQPAEVQRTYRLQAEEQLRQCADVIEQAHGPMHFYRTFALFGLGESMAKRGEVEKGARVCRQGLEVIRLTSGWFHDKMPILMERYARLLRELKRTDEAHAEFAAMLKAIESRYGKSHFTYANALVSYAAFLEHLADHAGVERVCLEARDIFDKTGGEKRKLYGLCNKYLEQARQARR